MKAALNCIAVLFALVLFTATAAPAADLVLSGGTAWKKDFVFNDGFWEFKRRVEKLSGGKIEVRWKGGPEIAPAFEMLSLVQRGVLDVLNSTGAYFTDKMAEGVFLDYFEGPVSGLREGGVIDFFDKIQQERTGVKLLGLPSGLVSYAIFTRKPVKTLADFKGMKLRGTPTYLPIADSLGASMIRMPYSDLYAALERGVVDGYFFPVIGTLGAKIHEQICCIVKPFFLTVRTWLYFSLKTWNKLTPEQQKLLTDAVIETEELAPAHYDKFIQAEHDTLVSKHGIQIIELPEDEGKRLREIAYEASLKKFVPVSPQYGKQIRELARPFEGK